MNDKTEALMRIEDDDQRALADAAFSDPSDGYEAWKQMNDKTSPRTAAGRALLERPHYDGLRDAILAIEAEAAESSPAPEPCPRGCGAPLGHAPNRFCGGPSPAPNAVAAWEPREAGTVYDNGRGLRRIRGTSGDHMVSIYDNEPGRLPSETPNTVGVSLTNANGAIHGPVNVLLDDLIAALPSPWRLTPAPEDNAAARAGLLFDKLWDDHGVLANWSHERVVCSCGWGDTDDVSFTDWFLHARNLLRESTDEPKP